jgi:predicted DNA-binding ribbon-helix-helix protein
MSQKPKGKSLVAKQSVVIGGRKTSITLERPFWTVLKEIAAQEEVSISTLVARIDADRQHANLSSVIRLFVLDHYRRQAEEKAKR